MIELFEQNIERNINGVVKVEQVNDIDILHQELSEFVVTSELKKHFKTFYMNYNNSLDVRTDKMGVWISGFFGSGKSHFLKMLSYLLENNEVQGKKAVDYFANKDLDDMTYADIKRAASVPTETILFNIDTKSAQETKLKESGIVDVFLKVFNEKLGYSSEFPNFADIERYFDSIGKYEEYKNSVCSKLDLTWDKAVAKLGFKKDVFIQSYIEITGQSEQSAKELFANATERRAFITPENFAKMIKEYLDSKGPKNRLIFLVDEIGQFISDNTNLMLNLQTVVENLGSYCNGRAWVMVTSQVLVKCLEELQYANLYTKDSAVVQEEETTQDTQIMPTIVDKVVETQPDGAEVADEPQELQEKHFVFEENQTGITYDKLFGPIFKGAKQITIIDPYIRNFFQTLNLMELIEVVEKNKSEADEVIINLTTSMDEFNDQSQTKNLETIREACFPMGINFTFTYDSKIHARSITTDTGWKVLLDRGLDIYQNCERKDAFQFTTRMQKYRPCKRFEITYLKDI